MKESVDSVKKREVCLNNISGTVRELESGSEER